MSNLVYPVLPGLTFDVHRKPIWHTDVRTTPSQREYRSTDQVYPRRKRQLQYEFLRSSAAFTELQTLEGFFNQHRGALQSFLFDDPDDNTAVAQGIGVGDGSTKDFQLVRAMGGAVEPVAAPNGAPEIRVAGALRTEGTHYSRVSGAMYPADASVIRFASAPAAGAVITWSGQFYWRTRFDKDEIDFVKFMARLWKAGQVDLYDTRT